LQADASEFADYADETAYFRALDAILSSASLAAVCTITNLFSDSRAATASGSNVWYVKKVSTDFLPELWLWNLTTSTGTTTAATTTIRTI
jgi:hypothetical protein